MAFNTKHKGKIDELIGGLNKRIESYNYKNDIFETKTLCRCMFGSIISQIRTAYLAIENREYVGFNIIWRSATEYLIDMKYISKKNDRTLNRRFVLYPILLIFWNKDNFKEIEIDHEEVTKRYRDYLYSDFKEELNKAKAKKNPSGIININETDRYIRDRYKMGWSGKSTIDRIKDIPEEKDNFKFHEYAQFAFKFLSNYTHPTPYGAIPYYMPNNAQNFEYQFDKELDDMSEEEGVILLAITVLVESMCSILNDDEATDLDGYLNTVWDASPELRSS